MLFRWMRMILSRRRCPDVHCGWFFGLPEKGLIKGLGKRIQIDSQLVLNVTYTFITTQVSFEKAADCGIWKLMLFKKTFPYCTIAPFQSKSWNSYLYPSLGQFCTLYSKVLGCQSCVNNRFSFSPFLTSPLTLFYGNFRQVSRHHTFSGHLTTVNWLKKSLKQKTLFIFYNVLLLFFIVSPKSSTEKPWRFHTENLGTWVWAMLYVNAEHVISCLSYLIL